MKIGSFISRHLSLILKLILIISIINAVYNQLWHIMSTNIFLLILTFIPQIIKKYEVRIPPAFEWILLIFVVFTLFLKRIGGIIAPIAFGLSVGFIGFMILAILYSSNQIKKNYFLIIMFSFNFAVAFGVALELLKYYLKILLGQTLSLEIYSYSMRNLVFVILGAGFSALIGYIYMKGYGKIRKIAEGFVKLNPELMRKDDEKEILEMIRKGENEKVEFKSSLRVNLHTKEIDRKVEHSALKTIVAFLNSEGGSLLIGVSNQKEIVGIDEDRFENEDKFTLHLTNLIKEKIGKKYLSLINITSACIKDKSIIRIDCKKSDRQIFLRPTPQEEEFYIRVGPSNAELKGSELVDYIEKKFRK